VFNEDLYTIPVLRALQSKITSDVLVMEGDTLLDIPLDELLDTHLISGASLTCLIKEFDMTKGGKGAKMADVESQDVFGISN
jgi:NDP-sugar pyrophosphorylase family protein